MLDVPSSTLASQEYWRTVIAEASIEFFCRQQVQQARSQFADHIDKWADRVPKYYQGSSEAVESLIDSLALVKTSFKTKSEDYGAGDTKDGYTLADVGDAKGLIEGVEDSYLLRNVEDLETLSRIMDCATETSAFLDGMELTLKAFRGKLGARRAAEPILVKWLHAQRQSILEAPYSLEDHERVVQVLIDTVQRVDDEVQDFEIVSHNVMLALQPMTCLVKKLCAWMEGHPSSVDQTANIIGWCKRVLRFLDDLERNYTSVCAN